jgi:glycosyltransferase involved in cell wall biosynthesis
MPKVSVIIPTYNRAQFLPRAIRSVQGQTFRDWELIVVDDGSIDGTQQLLRAWADMRVVSQPNRGVSAARNAGVRIASGEWIAFLDSDDEWRPEKLERQMECVANRPAIWIWHTDETWFRNGKLLRQKAHHRKQGGLFFDRAVERCLISPSSVMIHRRLVERVGLFDESLPAAEDYDLWLRVTAFYEVGFVPEPLTIKHAEAENQLSVVTQSIDRYRIRALVKILENPSLDVSLREAATRELERKCRILASGLAKRGKLADAEEYLELAERYANGVGVAVVDKPC